MIDSRHVLENIDRIVDRSQYVHLPVSGVIQPQAGVRRLLLVISVMCICLTVVFFGSINDTWL